MAVQVSGITLDWGGLLWRGIQIWAQAGTSRAAGGPSPGQIVHANGVLRAGQALVALQSMFGLEGRYSTCPRYINRPLHTGALDTWEDDETLTPCSPAIVAGRLERASSAEQSQSSE